jgi:hypothetical protein
MILARAAAARNTSGAAGPRIASEIELKDIGVPANPQADSAEAGLICL